MYSQPTLLVDMDFFCYRAAQAAEEELEFDSDLTVVVGSFATGQRIVKQQLKDLRTRFDTEDLVLFWTDKKNFRKSVDSEYKGNRIKRKPAGYLKLKKWCMNTWESVLKPNLEADDALGIAATDGSYKNFVLVSPDKDLEQIPCRIYNLKNEFTQTPEAAERKLWHQCLCGDRVDGFRGVPGCGPKRADNILDRRKGSYWDACLKAYRDAGLTKEDALRNLRLARILQASDWDADKQEPILFTPTNDENDRKGDDSD